MSHDIDYDLVDSGPLYVPEKYKQAGFQYCYVSDKPGELEMYQRFGYEVVKDDGEESIQVKSKPNRSTPHGAAVTVQSKCGQLLVLMKISQPLFEKFQEHKHKKIAATAAAMGQIDGVPLEYQVGEISSKINKYSK